MTLLNTSLRRKSPLFLVAAMLSLPSFAADFNQTQRLANQGDARAQYDLGLMYSEGKELRQDYAKAAEWFGKAVNQGDHRSQAMLGVMYNKGKGVRQNVATAKEWFGKACDNGDQNGCDGYRLLNQR